MNRTFHPLAAILTIITCLILTIPTFAQPHEVKIENPDIGHITEEFGCCMAVDGDVLVVGASATNLGGVKGVGLAKVYRANSEGKWEIEAELLPTDYAEWLFFGRSVAVSGNTVVVASSVGNSLVEGSGVVYVFTHANGNWTQQDKLTAFDADRSDGFGRSVAISGDSMLVSAFNDKYPGTAYTGSVYAFTRSNGSWTFNSKFRASGDFESWGFGDKFGNSIAISGDVAVIGAKGSVVQYGIYKEKQCGAAYIFTCSDGTWSQQVRLVPSDPDQSGLFGSVVSISGSTAIIGDYFNEHAGILSGAAYVFVGSGNSWAQQAKLITSDPNEYRYFGYSVSISGDKALIGAADPSPSYPDGEESITSAYAFTRSGNNWIQKQKITASDASDRDEFGVTTLVSENAAFIASTHNCDLGFRAGTVYVYSQNSGNWDEEYRLNSPDIAQGDRMGQSVAIYGDTIMAGVYKDDEMGENAGAVHVFKRSNQSWVHQGRLLPADAASWSLFGDNIAISSDTAVIGAYSDDELGYNSGAAYIFSLSNNIWTEEIRLIPQDVPYSPNGYEFGKGVAISGDTVLIGVPGANDRGIACFYTRSGGTWALEHEIDIRYQLGYAASFGWAVSLSGDTAVIGAYKDDGRQSDSGSAYVYVRADGSWVQQAKLTADDGRKDDYFGYAVSVDGDMALIGACRDDSPTTDTGSVYVFTRSGEEWTQQAKLTASDALENGRFGNSVSFKDDTALIGSYYDSDKGSQSGSAYIFKRFNDSWIEQRKITASDSRVKDEFGYSVAMSSEGYVVIGAPGKNSPEPDSGAAYVYSPEAVQLEMLKGHLLTSSPVPDELLPDADVNGDGKLDVGDINTLLAQ